MKKLAVLLSSMLIAASITGCYTRETDERTQDQNRANKRMNYSDTGINRGTMQGYNTSQGTTQSNTAGAFKDGTYTAYGDATSAGNQAATVNISSGRIISVVLDNTDKAGNKVNNKGNTTLGGVNNTDSRTELANAIVKNQTYDVNVSGGNTQDINNWKLAVRRALDNARR
jgi:uncharacterized protein with FMN-binding domain